MEDMENKVPEAVETETPVAEKKAGKEEKALTKKAAKNKVSFGEKLGKFFRSYRSEVKKITWCPWKMVRKNTLVVVVVVVVLSVGVCALDFALSKGILEGIPSLIG